MEAPTSADGAPGRMVAPRITLSSKPLPTADHGALYARGPALEVTTTFRKSFASPEHFRDLPLAKDLGPFTSVATSNLALTRNPLVLVRVTDSSGQPIGRVQLELLDEEGLFVDAVESDAIGLGLLRWPSQGPEVGSPEIKGKVRAAGTQAAEFTLAAGKDIVVVPIAFPGAPLPNLPGTEETQDQPRHDSVVPRLPAFFSAEAADEISRLRTTADGPDPDFKQAVSRQMTYRAPRTRWLYTRRTAYSGLKPPRRLYVRVRQEWHYLGHSFGQPERIDGRDVASLVGSLDANLDARLQVNAGLDVSTASTLTADASAKVRAAASLEGELDANVGLHLFEGGLGNPLSVSGDADVSIETSLLVSAQLKLRASLRNQLHARAALSGRASVGLEADASVGVNPSLSRALNLPRFVIHEDYLVTSFVEDVQELQEIELFDDLSEKTVIPLPSLPFLPPVLVSSPLFPPADIVEYRPIFQSQLLEPALAGRFGPLRAALDGASGWGPRVRQLRFDVSFVATSPATLTVRLDQQHVQVRLPAGQSSVRMALNLPEGRYLKQLNQQNFQFDLTLSVLEAIMNPTAASVQVTQIAAYSEACPAPQVISTFPQPLQVNLASPTATSGPVDANLPSTDAGLMDDPLVVHVNRNPTYYMGLLVKAALRNPSLRFDAPQLRRIGADNVIWKLPIHGFAGNKALVLVPAKGKEVDAILADVGRATVIQLAVDGNWTETMQGSNAITDALGQLFPGIANLQLPLALLAGLGATAGLQSAIVDGAGTAAGIGDAAGTVPSANGSTGTVLGALVDGAT